jgi:hypothetical protein
MRRGCSGCGRPIVAARKTRPGRKIMFAPPKDHDLCTRCWEAERAKNYARKERKEAM